MNRTGKNKIFSIFPEDRATRTKNSNEELFTYPGPNPFTKEQAILMMADAVEAASRQSSGIYRRDNQQPSRQDYRSQVH